MTTVVDLLDEKRKNNYLQYLRNEAIELLERFRKRGIFPEPIYDILDAFSLHRTLPGNIEFARD